MRTIRFVQEGKGLTTKLGESYFTNSDTELVKTLEIDAEITRDHGTMNVPVRLPRHLMPEWSQEEWDSFITSELGMFSDFVDEAIVVGLSLAIASRDKLRKEVLQASNAVVIDFRGDIPNGWFAMMWGGYKIGVYRSGQGWPIWMSIAPTYDLAIEEEKKLRDQAGLPKNSIQATGALLYFLNAKIGPPLMSSRAYVSYHWSHLCSSLESEAGLYAEFSCEKSGAKYTLYDVISGR